MSSTNRVTSKSNGRIFGQVIMVLVVLLILINIPMGYYGWRLNSNQAPPPPVLVTGDSPFRLKLTPFKSETDQPLPMSLYILWWLMGGGALVMGSWLAWRVLKPDAVGVTNEFFSYQLNQALTYQTQINHLLQTTATPYNQAQHDQISAQLDTWLATLQTLTQHLTQLQQDALWQQDLVIAPQVIAKLEQRLAYETNPMLRQQLTDSIHNHQQQLTLLSGLQNSINQTEVQIASTLALLGTMYAQLLTTQSTHQATNYSRLTYDITEEVARLQDRLEALQEVNALASR